MSIHRTSHRSRFWFRLRCFYAIACLLLRGKCLTEFGLTLRIFVILLFLRILFAIALALLFGKGLTQCGLLQGFILFLRIADQFWLRFIPTVALLLLRDPLRRQLDAVGGQLTPGWNTHRIWPWQFRADALLDLRACIAGGSERWHEGVVYHASGHCGCGSCRWFHDLSGAETR
ncbi:hypothetical protein D3C75_950350 [compost metagenome]